MPPFVHLLEKAAAKSKKGVFLRHLSIEFAGSDHIRSDRFDRYADKLSREAHQLVQRATKLL